MCCVVRRVSGRQAVCFYDSFCDAPRRRGMVTVRGGGESVAQCRLVYPPCGPVSAGPGPLVVRASPPTLRVAAGVEPRVRDIAAYLAICDRRQPLIAERCARLPEVSLHHLSLWSRFRSALAGIGPGSVGSVTGRLMAAGQQPAACAPLGLIRRRPVAHRQQFGTHPRRSTLAKLCVSTSA